MDHLLWGFIPVSKPEHFNTFLVLLILAVKNAKNGEFKKYDPATAGASPATAGASPATAGFFILISNVYDI